MTWLLMNTGREHLLPNHPDRAPLGPYTPNLGEVAHALAHINRFTGHAERAYSVAEHSLLVADMAKADDMGTMIEICALMHDAHESITGDVATPIKQVLGEAWGRFERAEQDALLRSYGLAEAMAEHASIITHYDRKALATERRDLLAFYPHTSTPWPIIDTPGIEIAAWDGAYLMAEHRVKTTPADWANRWMWRTAVLINSVQAMDTTAITAHKRVHA